MEKITFIIQAETNPRLFWSKYSYQPNSLIKMYNLIVQDRLITLHLQIYQTMSRRRNRHRSLSNSSRHSDRPTPDAVKLNSFRSTTHSVYLPRQNQSQQINYDLHREGKLYNRYIQYDGRNISFFRDNFNQNDTSQLPFMSSLRQKPNFSSDKYNETLQRPSNLTICSPFDTALKKTANQAIKKRISDFGAKQTRLSPAYYRWHNKSGRNNKWGVEFQCSLRDYGSQPISPEKDFYPYVKPIVYNDVEPRLYSQEEMICSRHNKSFKIR